MWRGVIGGLAVLLLATGCATTGGHQATTRRFERQAAMAQGRPELQVRNGGLPAQTVTVTRLAGLERVATQMSYKRYYTIVGRPDGGGGEVGLVHFYLYNGAQTVAQSGPSALQISPADPHLAEASWRYSLHGGPSGTIRATADGNAHQLRIAGQVYDLRKGNFFRLILLPEGYLRINQMQVIDCQPTDPAAAEKLFDQYIAWLRLWDL